MESPQYSPDEWIEHSLEEILGEVIECRKQGALLLAALEAQLPGERRSYASGFLGETLTKEYRLGQAHTDLTEALDALGRRINVLIGKESTLSEANKKKLYQLAHDYTETKKLLEKVRDAWRICTNTPPVTSEEIMDIAKEVLKEQKRPDHFLRRTLH